MQLEMWEEETTRSFGIESKSRRGAKENPRCWGCRLPSRLAAVAAEFLFVRALVGAIFLLHC